MTTDELNAIVQAVMLELEKAGVDFDFKAETPQATDLVYVMRGTADKYQGITVKWQNLLDIIVQKATEARDDAISAKDIALQTLATIQSIESNVSSMKSSVETSEANVASMKASVETSEARVTQIKSEAEQTLAEATQTVTGKADKTYVDGELAKKADITYVDGKLANKADKSELAVERARIDSLSTLPEGSTTGDAELIDLRIGADGVTYGNAGNAVRTQFSDLKGDLGNINTELFVKSDNLFDLQNAKHNQHPSNSGIWDTYTTLANYNTSNLIEVDGSQNKYVTIKDNVPVTASYIYYWDSNKSFIGKENGENPFTPPSNAKYMRIAGSDNILFYDDKTAVKIYFDGMGYDVNPYGRIRNVYIKNELNEEVIDYLKPLKIIDNAWLYPVTSNGKLYAGIDANYQIAIYGLKKEESYEIKSQAINNSLCGFATSKSFSYEMNDSGYTFLGNYIDYQNNASTDVSKNNYTPSEDSYLYVQTLKTSTVLHPNNSVKGKIIKLITDSLRKDVNELKEKVYTSKGLYFDGTSYTHFTKINDTDYLCREFKRVYANNLFQFYKMYIGNIANNIITEKELIGVCYSDIVGPISIGTQQYDNFSWSGGVHTVNVNGIEYPTAEQHSLNVLCNGKVISKKGMYYGDVIINTENYLYFPQNITDSTLSENNRAIIEKRIYTLNDKMTVRVSLEFLKDVWVSTYYGCQMFPWGMDYVIFPNCMEKHDVSTSYKNTKHFENKYVFGEQSGNKHYDVSVEPWGLGLFENTDSTNGYGLIAGTSSHKCYYMLIQQSSGKKFEEGKILMWQGCYDYYIS